VDLIDIPAFNRFYLGFLVVEPGKKDWGIIDDIPPLGSDLDRPILSIREEVPERPIVDGDAVVKYMLIAVEQGSGNERIDRRRNCFACRCLPFDLTHAVRDPISEQIALATDNLVMPIDLDARIRVMVLVRKEFCFVLD